MPDWSYHTLFRPILFQLPAKLARDITLRVMGGLCKMPGGTLVIRTFGHMELFPILDETKWNVRFKYPVGLSGGLDVHGVGRKALSQIGFGFIEVGPVTVQEIRNELPIQRDLDEETIIYPDAYANDGLGQHLQRLREGANRGEVGGESALPLMFRTRHMPGSTVEEALEEQVQLLTTLEPYASGFYLDGIDRNWSVEQTSEHLRKVTSEARTICGNKPLFLYIPSDYPALQLEQLLSRFPLEQMMQGVVLGDAIHTETGYRIGRESKSYCLDLMGRLRSQYGQKIAIIASGGIHEPQDALDLMEAGGADLIQLHSGLVYSGPGLPKRINEAILHQRLTEQTPEPPLPSFWSNWGWIALFGICMIIGGIIAWIIAGTTVLLPYDEEFLGMDRKMLNFHNENLLPFMSHDRITLAGTMISIGVLYTQFARYGQRFQLHWARTALLASAAIGFASFFLYLGYGYFDPLHAAVSLLLLPLFLLGMRNGKDNRPLRQRQPNLVNDKNWYRAQRGQLMFVLLGFSLAAGGIVISIVGVTHVFVPQDLTFLHTHPGMLDNANPKLISLIAHDRAGFGGALFSNAIAILAASLWGIQQGQRWLWWTLLIGGLPGFVAGFGVHGVIGYTDFVHLSPAYLAFGFYVAGLIWLYPYMHDLNKKENVNRKRINVG
jgi:dihydroorotate dehydrogenase